MQDFEASGKFYTPEQPDNMVAGKLSFTAESGIKLVLIGSFENKSIPKQKECEIILGVCADCPHGNLVTLLDNMPMGSSFAHPGIEQEHYSPRLLVTGGHLLNGLSESFNELEIQTNYLDAWIDVYSYSMEIPKDFSGWDGLKIQYKAPSHKKIKFPMGTICAAHGGSIPFRTRRKTTLYDEVKLRVELKKPTPIKSLHKLIIDPIQSFLSFATCEANRVTQLSLITEKNDTPPYSSSGIKL